MSTRARIAVAVVLLAFVIIRITSGAGAEPGEPTTGAIPLSEQRIDAVSVFEEAQAQDRPVYVLFHSLTCVPCVEISAVVDEVVPEYQEEIAFVNAISDDPSAQQLASRFSFRYIPMSFFITSEGVVLDSHSGVLSAEEMRERLDALLEAE